MIRSDRRSGLFKSSIRRLACLAVLSLIACAPSGDDSQLFRKLPQGDLPLAGKTFGASVLDLNHDDYPDLLLSSHGNAAVLLTGQATGVFRRFDPPTVPSGLFDQHGAAACDYDNDGLWDAYITVGAHRGEGWSLNQLWKQRQGGRFENEAVGFGVLADSVGRGRGALWADFDRDTRPELLVLNYRSPIRLLAQRDEVWRDETHRLPVVPDFPFWSSKQIMPTPMERRASSWSHNASTGDLDNDGWTDLYITSKSGTSGVWLNSAEGTLEDNTGIVGLSSAVWPQAPAHSALGDIDEDGDLDLLLAYGASDEGSTHRGPLEIRFNSLNENGRFGPPIPIDCVPDSIVPQSCLLADLNNDGHLDIYLVVENESDSSPANLMLKGLGEGRFSDVTSTWSGVRPDRGAPESAIAFDFDLDGDLDLMTFDGGSDSTSHNGGATSYENRSKQRKGVTIVLDDPEGTPHGLGARITCASQMREVRSVATPFSSSILPVHFGLSEHSGPIDVTIHWPDSGGALTAQTVTLPTSGAAYRVTRGKATAEKLPKAANR